MFFERNPFPYLKQEQYAGKGNGEIVFLDKTIPENEKEWLKTEYKKWWEEREKEILENGFM